MNFKKYIILLLCIYSAGMVSAQLHVEPEPSVSLVECSIGLGGNVPLGDLKDRYGANLHFSLGGGYITSKNWLLNAEFMYLYGDKVKEDVLAPFRTSSGAIPGDDNQIADVFLRQRGIYMGLGVGRLFPLIKDSRSGIKLLISGGLLQHQIHFVDERNSVGQIRAGRQVGYDRLTRGFSLKETIAYKHLSNDRRLNFEFALDFIQGFTSEVRAYNFDTGLPTIPSRTDMLIGLRIVWNFPIYFGSSQDIFY
ncbi:MAG: hypothetical protein WAU01_10005 [Saprospiraceae bacterium]